MNTPNPAYQRILDNQTTALILLDQDLSVAFINNATESLLGISNARSQGQPLSELSNNPGWATELQQAMMSGQPHTKRETQITTSQSKTLTVNYTVTPFSDDQPYLLIEIFPMDRWLRISREEHMLTQHETARALIKGFAHEIKNPLGGMRGAAQLLSRRLEDGDEQYTDVIIQEVDRLSSLVDSMLGPTHLVPRNNVNIHEVLERVIQLISAEDAQRISITRDYDPSIPELHANQEQLMQAVLNIARNACKAMTDTATSKLTIRTRPAHQLTLGQTRHKVVCQIDIEDNGPGIPSTLQETLFYPMVSGHSGGTGLGLTIAQHLINGHGGLIEFESSPGCTCFTLFIPFLQEGSHTHG